MNCIKYSKMMTDFLAGELSDQDKAALDAHLASCENCRKEFEQLKEVWSLTESALKADFFDDTLKSDRHQNIVSSASQPRPLESSKKSDTIKFRFLEIAASIAICVILGSILIGVYSVANRKMGSSNRDFALYCKDLAQNVEQKAAGAVSTLSSGTEASEAQADVRTKSEDLLRELDESGPGQRVTRSGPAQPQSAPAAAPAGESKHGHESMSFSNIVMKGSSWPEFPSLFSSKEEAAAAPAKKSKPSERVVAQSAPTSGPADFFKPGNEVLLYDKAADSDKDEVSRIDEVQKAPAAKAYGYRSAKKAVPAATTPSVPEPAKPAAVALGERSKDVSAGFVNGHASGYTGAASSDKKEIEKLKKEVSGLQKEYKRAMGLEEGEAPAKTGASKAFALERTSGNKSSEAGEELAVMRQEIAPSEVKIEQADTTIEVEGPAENAKSQSVNIGSTTSDVSVGVPASPSVPMSNVLAVAPSNSPLVLPGAMEGRSRGGKAVAIKKHGGSASVEAGEKKADDGLLSIEDKPAKKLKESIPLDSMETRLYPVKKEVLREIGGSNEELINYFRGKGIAFGEYCKLNYDSELGRLTICNVPDEQRKMEGIIKGLEYAYEKSKEFKNGIPFSATRQKPFSTFSIDVDTASYTMARKQLRDGIKPDPFSVRPEEFINYFDYHYRSPSNSTFAVHLEMAPSVFRPEDLTLRVGVKARDIGPDGSRASVFTILIDASGSMSRESRMDLVKKTLPLLFDQMKPDDKIAILACTHRVFNLAGYMPASEKKTISRLVEGIMPAGVADIENGLVTAYDLALKNYEPGAYNRVILITDGISNIGSKSAEKILSKVSASRNMGVTNTIVALGGEGDDKFLETVANKGDGSYVFIDNEDSAREVFVNEFAGRFREIARDVKIQVEFNPQIVNQYRQIGYQNRQLSKADFRNDKVDAGEVGAGQSVTALYELKLGKKLPQGEATIENPMAESVCIVRLRYRRTDTMDIEEKEFMLPLYEVKTSFAKASCGFRLAASVAEFAEFLRFPDVPGIANPYNVMRQIQGVLGEDYKNDGKVSELYSLIKNVK
ncbi:MAG TPA: hypothetical protein DET40_09470 [Lentisphaeria bacterium]|nr:MAG: hypothetical protein A2X45_08260 [Lentisphaerae bacterium GWF2_50_93]HCE43765.1 hypothetical protein [Lentisphaeria bacterium]